jgi:putative flavoprotein involved in K+ transport
VQHKIIIIGAGPAGIGSALALTRAGIKDIVILEANCVGSSFRRWPKQMRLITPSFHTNSFYQTDLNSITPDTSPADFFQKQHLTGSEYADYLNTGVAHFGLNVLEQVRVSQITSEREGYCVHTDKETYKANIVIWAAGEFSLPKLKPFEGDELCAHSSVFRDWNDYQGKDALVIGGYESGIDAAFNLVEIGKRVIVLSSGEPWKVDHPDPSEILSPYTRDRLISTLKGNPGKMVLRGNCKVLSVSKLSDRYIVETDDGEIFESEHRPIAATGFQSALTPVKDLFEWENSLPIFTDEDESTLYPGIYYSGPSLVHNNSKFCFIYKFRARFGVIARSVAKRLGYPEPDLEDDRRRGFLVDDLECCTNCECAVESVAEPVQQNV